MGTERDAMKLRQKIINVDKCISLRRNPQYLAEKQMQALVRSIQRYGFLSPVLVRPHDSGTYEILSGNHRVLAAREAGLENIPVLIGDFTDDEARVIAVNLNTIHGNPEPAVLAPFVAEIKDEMLPDVFFDQALLDEMKEFDDELVRTLSDLSIVPNEINVRREKTKTPACICPKCGKKHVAVDMDNA